MTAKFPELHCCIGANPPISESNVRHTQYRTARRLQAGIYSKRCSALRRERVPDFN